MKSFKHFFLEAVESKQNLPPPPEKFVVPPPKAKFQLGDVLLVQSPQGEDYIKRVMPKYLHNYTNAIGRVIGYRTVGSGSYISTEYALEFEDGKIGKIKSHLLVGPFRSFATAKKYQGKGRLTSTDIASEDHKRFAEAQSETESNIEIESAFKRMFIDDFGFTWLDKPLTFVKGKFKVMALAIKPQDFGTDSLPWGYDEQAPEILKKSLCFFKTIDPVTSKLAKTSSINHDSKQAAYGFVVPYLYLHASRFENGKVANAGLGHHVRAVPSPKAFSAIQNELTVANKILSIKDAIEYFDFVNEVEVRGNTKIVNKNRRDATIESGMTADINAFKNYIFEVNTFAQCIINGQVVFPKEVKGDISISANAKNLVGFPKVGGDVVVSGPIGSMEGLPKILNNKLTLWKLDSLQGFPEVINGDCKMNNLKSFDGGENSVINGKLSIMNGPSSFENIPTANDYAWYQKSSEEIEEIKAWVNKKRKMTAAIKKSGIEKDFDISALDDF